MTIQVHYILEKRTEEVETVENCTVSTLQGLLGSDLLILVNGLVRNADFVIGKDDLVSAMPILEGG